MERLQKTVGREVGYAYFTETGKCDSILPSPMTVLVHANNTARGVDD